MTTAYMHPNDIVGKTRLGIIEAWHGNKRTRAGVWSLARTESSETINHVAWNMVYFWNPRLLGTKVPSVILAVALASRMSIEKIARFAASDTFAHALTSEIQLYCVKSERVAKRRYALGLELDSITDFYDPYINDFGRHLILDAMMLDPTQSPEDWTGFINHLTAPDNLGELRKGVVGSVIKAASPAQSADFALALAEASFPLMNLIEEKEHPATQVARLHWVLQALRKSGNTETMKLLFEEYFSKLRFIPPNVRGEILNLVRDFNLATYPWLVRSQRPTIQSVLTPSQVLSLRASVR